MNRLDRRELSLLDTAVRSAGGSPVRLPDSDNYAVETADPTAFLRRLGANPSLLPPTLTPKQMMAPILQPRPGRPFVLYWLAINRPS